jgi:hypothetical protein
MPAFQRSFNPYSNVPPPPASLPDFEIISSSIHPLADNEAGELIDAFLRTQDGKILILHRLADHLLGRTRTADTGELEELEHVLEEERRREGGIVAVQLDHPFVEEEDMEDGNDDANQQEVPRIEIDRRKARKEERRIKKEKQRENRKKEEQSDIEGVPSPKKAKERNSKR